MFSVVKQRGVGIPRILVATLFRMLKGCHRFCYIVHDDNDDEVWILSDNDDSENNDESDDSENNDDKNEANPKPIIQRLIP